jgi:hypothetical protein
MAVDLTERPYGYDWCRMPIPIRIDSDKKTTQAAVKSIWRLTVPSPAGFTNGKVLTIVYGDVEITLQSTTTPAADNGNQYLAEDVSGLVGVYFQRNYYINRDFIVSSSSSIGVYSLIFTAINDGAQYNPTILTDDSAITFTQVIAGADATPNPNFAYLVDIYLQKENSDDLNDIPFTKLPTMVLAPNTDESEVDIASEIFPYTNPQPPTPFPGIGFTQPEYMRKQALRYKVKFAEAYGTTPAPQIGQEMISLLPFIDCSIAFRGGVRKDIYDYIYNTGDGTAGTWFTERLWLTSLPGGTWRRVSIRQYNWLSILTNSIIDDAIVKIKYYNTSSGSTEYNLFTLAWPAGRTSDDYLPLRIPVGLPTALPIHAPSFAFNKYEIRIVDGNDGTELYAPVTFYVEPEHTLERTLIFENSLGGWESWRFIGGKVHFAEVTGEVYTKLNDLFNNVKHTPDMGNHNTMLQEEMELNSGPLANLDEVYLLLELLISECVYYHNFFDEHKDYFRVVRIADTFQLHQDDNNHFYISFKVRKAWKDSTHGFLPVF